MKQVEEVIELLFSKGFEIAPNWKHKAIENGNYIIEISKDSWIYYLNIFVKDNTHLIHEEALISLLKNFQHSSLRKKIKNLTS